MMKKVIRFVHGLRKFKVCSYVLDTISYYKLDLWFYRLTDKGMREEDIQSGKKFFRKNRKKVEEVCSFLEDEKSKNIYKRMILVRMTGKYDKLPKTCDREIRNQYFDKDIIKIDKQDVMIDGGAWLGDTFRRFFRLGGGRVVAFEPGDTLFRSIRIRRGWNVKKIHAGLWERKTVLKYATGAGTVVGDDYNGTDVLKINVTSIDETPECHDATFIKLDIEGSELSALGGGYNTIKRNHPKLAICIYHSNADMVEIPLWLHDNFPDYKYYVRHYGYGICETVIYAV